MILRSYELHSLIYIVIYKSKEKENEKKMHWFWHQILKIYLKNYIIGNFDQEVMSNASMILLFKMILYDYNPWISFYYFLN